MKQLFFDNELMEGLILKRKNRFIMEVLINNNIELCHCPCTGTIGNIVFNTIPCLLSFNNTNSKRKTNYTVEAISLNEINSTNKNWIGINQIKSNNFIEYFLKNNLLPNIINIDEKSIILRECNTHNSKLDFLINNNIYLEIKTPLIILPLKSNYYDNLNIKKNIKNTIVSHERFFKHLDELSDSLAYNQKAIMISFYMFEADKFIPPKNNKSFLIKDKVISTLNNGVEFWQVNTKFTNCSIELVDYYKTDFE